MCGWAGQCVTWVAPAAVLWEPCRTGCFARGRAKAGGRRCCQVKSQGAAHRPGEGQKESKCSTAGSETLYYLHAGADLSLLYRRMFSSMPALYLLGASSTQLSLSQPKMCPDVAKITLAKSRCSKRRFFWDGSFIGRGNECHIREIKNRKEGLEIS